MQGQNSQSQPTATVARHPLDLADYIELLRRHKGRIFASVFAALVISVVAAFFLPETKGKTLEEIEAYFSRAKSPVATKTA